MRDADLIVRLLESGRRTYSVLEADQVARLLEQTPSVLWLRGQTLLGAAVFDRSLRFTATASLLAVRYRDDQAPFFRHILPCAEEALVRFRAHWACIICPDDWLIGPLRGCGYAPHTHLVTYRETSHTDNSSLVRCALEHHPFSVRKADRNDVSALLFLDSEVFEPFWQLDEQFMRRAIQADYLLVATRGERMVGYILAQKHGNNAHIARLGVSSIDRRRGVGACLITHTIGDLVRQGASHFWLETQENNLISRRFYEKLGFRLIGKPRELWAKSLSANIANF